MISNTNPVCGTCRKAYNSVNGRYCNKLDRMVEYEKEPPCGIKKMTNYD